MVGSLAPCALSALLRPAPLLGLFGVLARCPFVPGPCPFMRSFSPSVGCCGLPSAQLLAPCALLRFKACAGSVPWVCLLSSVPVRVLFGFLGPPAPLPPLLAPRALLSFFRACAIGVLAVAPFSGVLGGGCLGAFTAFCLMLGCLAFACSFSQAFISWRGLLLFFPM